MGFACRSYSLRDNLSFGEHVCEQDKYLQKVHFSRHAIPLPDFMQVITHHLINFTSISKLNIN